MSVLAPGYLVATLAAALLVVAAHLIAWRRPTDALLPTARFVPDEPTRRSARAIRPSDLALLALRLAILALVGLALARPVATPSRSGVARVIAVDRSRAVGNPGEVRDSALAVLGDATTRVLLAVDSGVMRIDADALADTAPPQARVASLSAALVALLREAESLRERHERVELAIVSPFVVGQFDAAIDDVRRLWPDSIRLVRVRAAPASAVEGALEVRAPADDPVEAGLRLARAHGVLVPQVPTRVVRSAPDGADSAWVRDANRLLVVWPALTTDSAPPSGTESGETVTGVHAGGATLVGHLRTTERTGDGAPVAWWLNGGVAARQTVAGAGCIRDVLFDVPGEGDLALTVRFQRLAAVLLEPCDGAAGEASMSDSVLARLAAPDSTWAGGTRGATAHGPTHATRGPNLLGVVLLVAAALLGVLEMLVRQRVRADLREEAVPA